MQITDVRVRKVNSQNRMKAIASITIDDVFVIHDIKVIESDKGLFIAMPSRKTPNGEFKDIAHPINTETREMIQRVILAKYAEEPELTAATEPAPVNYVQENLVVEPVVEPIQPVVEPVQPVIDVQVPVEPMVEPMIDFSNNPEEPLV